MRSVVLYLFCCCLIFKVASPMPFDHVGENRTDDENELNEYDLPYMCSMLNYPTEENDEEAAKQEDEGVLVKEVVRKVETRNFKFLSVSADETFSSDVKSHTSIRKHRIEYQEQEENIYYHLRNQKQKW